MSTTTICVLGAINMDLVARTPSIPLAGMSVLGSDFQTFAGGKGANRAVAAARLGAAVGLIGCVGDDAWGADLRAALVGEGVAIGGLATRAEEHSGASLIAVVPSGETASVSVPNANDSLTPEDVDAASEAISSADVLIAHREIPEDALLRAIELAKKFETRVLMHAVPTGAVSTEVLSQVDILVVQEKGARELVHAESEVSPSGLARRLHALGPERVVITLGGRGALSFNGEKVLEVEAPSIEAVDTTAAGAAFVAAYAVARGEGERGEPALRFACAAGALTASKPGALPSLPTRAEVEGMLEPS